jgi:hypothetical protein
MLVVLVLVEGAALEPVLADKGPANRPEPRLDSPSLLPLVVVLVLLLLLLLMLLSPAPTAAKRGASIISTASGHTIRNACKAFFLS